MTTVWEPVEPAGDFHSWARPRAGDCPSCKCCSERLCEKARQQGLLCSHLGSSGDFDLAECPCSQDPEAFINHQADTAW